MRISACWITKNEAVNIRRSIDSVIDAVDELVVVDTGSTDDTVDIAKSCGARVEYFEWINDFAAARNHAISFATGDIFLILDADESFEPPFSIDDREMVINKFANNPSLEMLSINVSNLEKADGTIKDTSISARFFRNLNSMRYTGKIHEVILPTHPYGNIFIEGINLNHIGYSQDVVAGKLERNSALLKASIAVPDLTIEDMVHHLFYLLRENFFLGHSDEAIAYLLDIMNHPKYIQRVLRTYNVTFSQQLSVAIDVAVRNRARVSRRDVYGKLISSFKDNYSQYNFSAKIDLLYQLLFDYKEDRFLEAILPATKVAASKSPMPVSYFKGHEASIYAVAALAARRRGDAAQAMEYAVSAYRCSKDRNNYDLLAALLTAIRSQPLKDIVMLINSLFDLSNPDDLTYLIRGTMLEGYREIRSYYIKKRSDLGNAPFDDFFELMLTYNKHEELIANAAEAYIAGETNAALYIFLAAICGAPDIFTDAHVDKLDEYAHILRAFHDRERLGAITDEDSRLLGGTYFTVALNVGVEAADRYLNVFRADPKLCFLVKATYCSMSGLPKHVLSEDMGDIDKLDFSCRRFRIQALIDVGKYADALMEIEVFLDTEIIEPELLHMLLVVAEKARGDTKTKARMMYNRYIDVYDALIDLGDVVNTGIVFDDGGIRLKKVYKSMSRGRFDMMLKEEADRPAIEALLDLYRKAADVYIEKNAHSEAARCLCRLLASGRAEQQDYEKLASVFTCLNNPVLPDYIRSLGKQVAQSSQET